MNIRQTFLICKIIGVISIGAALLTACGEKPADEEVDRSSYAQMTLARIEGNKQLKTMNDLRQIGMALSMFRIDNGSFPGGDFETGLIPALEPAHMAQIPRNDGWGNAFIYTSDGSTYQLSSPGKDGRGGHSSDIHFDRYDFDHSITYANGAFTASPARTP